MVNLKNKTIHYDGDGSVGEEIVRFEVWFQTPKGLCDDLKAALEAVEGMDMDEMAIRPVPVAIGEHGNYEIMG